MAEELRLLMATAHPDDESLGVGGMLAKYAAEGVATFVVAGTRGERGRIGPDGGRPGPEVAGPIREAELRAAAAELGVRGVSFLGYLDQELDAADPAEAIARIASEVRRIRPHVVVTFPPDGAYGHPDHIAISQLTTAATVVAADAAYDPDEWSGEGWAGSGDGPHRVAKLYYMAWPQTKWDAYQAAFRTLVSHVDGAERRAIPWPDWAITTRIDTEAHWNTVWRAVRCHESQLAVYEKLGELSPRHHRGLWGTQEFYRAFSLVNGGRELETDLFAGLR